MLSRDRHNTNGGPIRNYDRFLNSISSKRTLSAIRRVWSIQNKAGPAMIGLGTGTPNPTIFPFKTMTIDTGDGVTFKLEGEEMSTALGYTATVGFPPLIDWLTHFQKNIHNPPFAKEQPELFELITVPGSEDGQCKIFEMMLEPGDPVLINEPAYPGALSALRPLGAELLAVQMDQDGVIPEKLEELLLEYGSVVENGSLRVDDHDVAQYQGLNSIDHSVPRDQEPHSKSQVSNSKNPSGRMGQKRPKLFVIQPNHVNPSGISTTLERRKQIYALACQYDLILVEDDPYYFLTFNSDHRPPPSLQSMDTEGRVLRLDSFSKVLSAGIRVGTVSGPKPLVDGVMMHVACSSLHASTLSQAILYRFFTEYGHDGYLKHCESVAEFYQNRCEAMLQAAGRHLTGLATWNRPSGGMFLWIKVIGVKDTRKMLEEQAMEKLVMLAPGCYFMREEEPVTPYLRASFSWASEESMNEGFKRLAEMIKVEQGKQLN